MRTLFLLLTAGLATPGQPAPITSDRWREHLERELLPFWTHPDALGDPVGAFPTTRCNDGSRVNWQAVCPEVRQNAWLLQRDEYLVARSRQTYAYGVAFHVTGDPRYLEWMRAGVQHIRAEWMDRGFGGMRTRIDRNGQSVPVPEWRNPQELAYGLLGVGFYYYLTRDPVVLADILAVHDFLMLRYWNGPLAAIQWQLADGGGARADERRFVAQLDQLNAYLILLTPILPEPHRSDWKQALRTIVQVMRTQFYSPEENLFFLNANRPADLDLRLSATDFGHTIKAFWMIRFAGQILGDAEMVQFADRNGPRVLERAFLADCGCWANGLRAGGAVDLNKSWWIYAELDQFAATLSLTNPYVGRFLPATYRYWLDRFVDPRHGEVWSELDGRTHQPTGSNPKAWPWKNGYHSMEHALVAYLTSRQQESQPVTLHYAFREWPFGSVIQPYFFQGAMRTVAQDARGTWSVSFGEIW